MFPADYSGLPANVMFNSCGRKCVNITIINDSEVEKVEMFLLTLTTNNSQATAKPDKAYISITDNIGADNICTCICVEVGFTFHRYCCGWI